MNKHVLISAIMLGLSTMPAVAQPQSVAAKPEAPLVRAERDGQRDFDFLFGKWKTHNRRLMNPLTGSNTWIEFDGTVVARSIWGGRANMDEFAADTPSGRVDGLTVRTYNSKTRQWSIYWANATNGAFSLPATVGEFKGDRGEFFDQEDYKGRSILVRY